MRMRQYLQAFCASSSIAAISSSSTQLGGLLEELSLSSSSKGDAYFPFQIKITAENVIQLTALERLDELTLLSTRIVRGSSEQPVPRAKLIPSDYCCQVGYESICHYTQRTQELLG